MIVHVEKFQYVGYRFLLKGVPYQDRFKIKTEYKDKLLTLLRKTFNISYSGFRSENLYDHMVQSGCFGCFFEVTIRKFDCQEDEDFFLLWSSGGIEI